MTMTTILTAVCVSYFAFIYTETYDEFQSWMIAYIAWMAIISIQTLMMIHCIQ